MKLVYPGSGMAWVDVSSDGKTVVANARETIYNRKTRRAVTLDVNQQVLITEDNIGEPEPMDQRFYKAQETMFNLGAFGGAEMYQQVAEKSDALLEASLIALKLMAEHTGRDSEKLKDPKPKNMLELLYTTKPIMSNSRDIVFVNALYAGTIICSFWAKGEKL